MDYHQTLEMSRYSISNRNRHSAEAEAHEQRTQRKLPSKRAALGPAAAVRAAVVQQQRAPPRDDEERAERRQRGVPDVWLGRQRRSERRFRSSWVREKRSSHSTRHTRSRLGHM